MYRQLYTPNRKFLQVFFNQEIESLNWAIAGGRLAKVGEPFAGMVISRGAQMVGPAVDLPSHVCRRQNASVPCATGSLTTRSTPEAQGYPNGDAALKAGDETNPLQPAVSPLPSCFPFEIFPGALVLDEMVEKYFNIGSLPDHRRDGQVLQMWRRHRGINIS
jgi:hypothetical protein